VYYFSIKIKVYNTIMQSIHSFSYNNYSVTLKTIDNNITFNIYDGYKCIHTGVLTEVDVITKHKITCAIAYKKYVVRAPYVPDLARSLNPPYITFNLYDGTVLTIQCK
jgi:hypothetical protein